MRVRTGGPFRYERDGVVFGNRERQLPARQHGYYHEYTVPTPGASSRGARRIVCGGPKTRRRCAISPPTTTGRLRGSANEGARPDGHRRSRRDPWHGGAESLKSAATHAHLRFAPVDLSKAHDRDAVRGDRWRAQAPRAFRPQLGRAGGRARGSRLARAHGIVVMLTHSAAYGRSHPTEWATLEDILAEACEIPEGAPRRVLGVRELNPRAGAPSGLCFAARLGIRREGAFMDFMRRRVLRAGGALSLAALPLAGRALDAGTIDGAWRERSRCRSAMTPPSGCGSLPGARIGGSSASDTLDARIRRADRRARAAPGGEPLSHRPVRHRRDARRRAADRRVRLPAGPVHAGAGRFAARLEEAPEAQVPEGPAPRWTRSLGAPAWASPVAGDGVVYVATPAARPRAAASRRRAAVAVAARHADLRRGGAGRRRPWRSSRNARC